MSEEKTKLDLIQTKSVFTVMTWKATTQWKKTFTSHRSEKEFVTKNVKHPSNSAIEKKSNHIGVGTWEEEEEKESSWRGRMNVTRIHHVYLSKDYIH